MSPPRPSSWHEPWHALTQSLQNPIFLDESRVEQRGIEHQATSAPIVADGAENTAICTTKDDSKPLEVSALCTPETVPTDAVEAALAIALVEAATAGRFDVVAQVARELEARRLARGGNVARLALQPATIKR